MEQKRDLYREVTDRIVAAIEMGAGEFHLPWHANNLPLARPSNAVTAKPYRGANILALWAAAVSCGYSSQVWATYKQWAGVGAQVRKGEHGSLIVFWKKMEREASPDTEDDGRKRGHYFLARASIVFNSEQVDGWELPVPKPIGVVEASETADRFIANTKAAIRFGDRQACYWYAKDEIEMPHPTLFTGTTTSTSTEAYYATLLHELTHWTGHESRLNRDLRNRFGDEAYSMEELVAEFGAAFLCAELGITNIPREDHAAYLAHWLKVLKDDKKAIFTAASRATQAADFLRGLQEKPAAMVTP